MVSHKQKQPQPVLTRAGVVTAISVLAALLVHFGASSAGTWLTANSSWIAGLILAAGPAVAGFLARAHVTPVASPKDSAGRHLVPVGSTPATLDASVALAAAEAIFPSADPAVQEAA